MAAPHREPKARTWASQTPHVASGLATGPAVIAAPDNTTSPLKIHSPCSNLARQHAPRTHRQRRTHSRQRLRKRLPLHRTRRSQQPLRPGRRAQNQDSDRKHSRLRSPLFKSMRSEHSVRPTDMSRQVRIWRFGAVFGVFGVFGAVWRLTISVPLVDDLLSQYEQADFNR
jgi:hypothetical protein